MKVLKNLITGFFGIGSGLLFWIFALIAFMAGGGQASEVEIFWYQTILFVIGIIVIGVTLLILFKDRLHISGRYMYVLWILYLMPIAFFTYIVLFH